MNDMRQMTSMGRNIENESFSIIDREAGNIHHPPDAWEVVRRIIHATADFEYKDLTLVHPQAIQSGISALKNGCAIVCDVQMIIAGLNKDRLDSYHCKTYSFISDTDVIAAARAANSTRAALAMKKAQDLNLLNGGIIAVGNAPTALLETARLVREQNIKPALVIGVPVGFVSASESKEAIIELEKTGNNIPYIVTRGRKGGSTIAVSVIHALLLLSAQGAGS